MSMAAAAAVACAPLQLVFAVSPLVTMCISQVKMCKANASGQL